MSAARLLVVVAVVALAVATGSAAFAQQEGWLGVMLQPLTDELIQAMDLQKGTEGVLIGDVVKGSPAETAGLQKGDVIVEMDGIKIDSADTAVQHVREKAPGDNVKVVVIREGKKEVITAVLGARPAEAEQKMTQQKEEQYYNLQIPRVDRVFKEAGFGGGFLGLRIQSMTPDLASYFGVHEGILVLDVEDDSPSAKAGLRGGDVIIKVDNQDVSDASDFREYIRDREPGQRVDLTFKRKGETRRVQVEVGKFGPAEMFMHRSGEPRAFMYGEGEPWMPEGVRIRKWITERGEGEAGQGCPPECPMMKHMQGQGMMKGMGEEGSGKMEMKPGEPCPMMKEMQKKGAEQGESSEPGGTMMKEESSESGCPMMKGKMQGMQKEGMWGQCMRGQGGCCMGMCDGKGSCMMVMRRPGGKGMLEGMRECMRECRHSSKECMKNIDKCREKMESGEMGGNLKSEIKELKQQIDDLKKELQSQKQS